MVQRLIHQLCVDTGYSLQDQPGAMHDKDDGKRASRNSVLSARLYIKLLSLNLFVYLNVSH